MALTVDQHQSNLKHFCKICKKGFGCGRALGGHMRAHGIGDESWNVDDDEDAASDWEEKLGGGGSGPPSTKRMYALRTNPNRLKSCRVCENCGKEFLSWKSFLEHGKCTSDDVESPVSSPMNDGDDYGDGDDDVGQTGCGWSKRKRSFRAKVGTLNSICPSSEEEDLANCLMMLSNAIVDPLVVPTEPEESSASASRDEERRNPINFITPISYTVPTVDHKAKSVLPKGLFECKACKKIFNSHQALGGHRASHKKVKGCFASRLEHIEDKDNDVITHEEFLPTKSNSIAHDHPHGSNASLLMASSSKRKSKVHECSICHRTFSSGQALGGHKRCHWITPNAPDSSTLARFQQFQDHMERMNQIPKFNNPLDLKLDLNLPAPAAEMNLARRDLSTEIYLQPWLGATAKEKDNNNIINNTNNSQCQSLSNGERHRHQHLQETENDNEEDKNNNNNSAVSMENVEDESDSKVKLAKLSELKDMNIGGTSSPWLQVGIGPTTGVRAEP